VASMSDLGWIADIPPTVMLNLFQHPFLLTCWTRRLSKVIVYSMREMSSGRGNLMLATFALIGAIRELTFIEMKSRADQAVPYVVVDQQFSLCRSGSRTACIMDGDTIWIEGEEVHVADADAPSIIQPRCAAEAELGRRATLRLQELVNSGPFYLERAGDRDMGNQFRKLRVLSRNGASLGEILVREGFARRERRGTSIPHWC
jgi:micrococcal nuclease